MVKRISYPVEVKEEAIKMKIEGKTTREIMNKLNIRNETQVNTWWRWYRNGESYRFSQGVGKQYTYGKGNENLSPLESLERENKYLKQEIDGLKKIQGIGKDVEKELFIKLVDSYKGVLSVTWLCHLCKENKFTYGYRKITFLLRKKIIINHKVVQCIMQKYGWGCKVKIKKKQRPGSIYFKTSNIIDRDFSSSKPLEKLTTDITYLDYGPKRLYLSSIMDLFNGEILSYTISEKQDISCVLDTLNKLPKLPNKCILHSDQGSVYTSYAYYQATKEKSIIRSMSRKGTPADNAPIESFHSILKAETFSLHPELGSSTISVIETVQNFINYYNKERIQQKYDYLSPVEYRKKVIA
ncbi:IS3 family transposase [Vagococcus bubulae]|uniref:IS3 family transposase n=1 Tax=Vagococcus bubulae TaxID=1977868 RepID=UPI003A521E3A